MRIYFDSGYPDNPLAEAESFVTYSLNKCKARKEFTDCFLFNKRKQSKNILLALKEEGFIPMPSLKSGGCKEYEPIEGHPYAHHE